MKTKTIKKIGYSFQGTAYFEDYSSKKGYIPMLRTTLYCDEELSSEDLKKEAIKRINSNQREVREIIGARCEVYELYEENVYEKILEFLYKDVSF